MKNIASLHDLNLELWLRLRDSDNIIWKTKDNKEIPIKDMSLSHLINTIKMLERQEEKYTYQEDLEGLDPNDL